MTVNKADFDVFKKHFCRAVARQVDVMGLSPLVWTDGTLEHDEISLATLAEIEDLSPYGREFGEPLFHGYFLIDSLRLVGAEPVHLSLRLTSGNRTFPAIWFRAVREPGQALPVAAGDEILCAYRLSGNEFRGRRNLQLQIIAAEKKDNHNETPELYQ